MVKYGWIVIADTQFGKNQHITNPIKSLKEATARKNHLISDIRKSIPKYKWAKNIRLKRIVW